MSNGITVQNCQSICHSNTVISTQGSSVCRDIIALYRKLKAILCKVMDYIRTFFTDHIHMTLENYSRSILISRGSGLVDHHIIHFILDILQSTILCELYQIITDLFCVP